MFGKREQIVALSIGVLATIFIVHIVVFDPRAKRYGEVLQRYTEGTQALSGARMPAGANVIPNFQKQTREYNDRVTSVVEQLSLDVPPYYSAMTLENILKRYQVVTDLVKELVEMRQTVRQPVLSFLDQRPNPQNPMLSEGWNFPRELPRTSNQVALGDTLRKAIDRYKIAETVPDPIQQLLARQEYNLLIDQIGARPAELANFYAIVNGQTIFFHDSKLAERLGGGAVTGGGGQGGFGGVSASGGIQIAANPFSLNRYGPFVPDLKRLLLTDLVLKKLQSGDNITGSDLAQLFETAQVLDDSLLYVERQLRGLIDVIRIAERNKITEISQVNLMKPVDLAASRKRGAPPAAADAAAPAATPAPEGGALGGFMGNMALGGRGGSGPVTMSAIPTVAPDKKVGVGTGIEMVFRGSNAATVDFLFEVGTSTRTYAIDDLYITARPNNEIETSTTIELVTKLEAK
jgi:hypothetical protein